MFLLNDLYGIVSSKPTLWAGDKTIAFLISCVSVKAVASILASLDLPRQLGVGLLMQIKPKSHLLILDQIQNQVLIS